MSEAVESSGELSGSFKAVPLVLHGPLIALGTVRRTEDPASSEAVIIISLNRLLQDPLSGASDRNDSSRILILTFRDDISCVHGSFYVNAVIIDVIELQAETFTRAKPCHDHEAECRPIPQIGRLEESLDIFLLQDLTFSLLAVLLYI